MSLKTEQKPRALVAAAERDKIDRNVLIWLNSFPEKPIANFTTESHLSVKDEGMALSSITSAYINRRYILGGYEAEYNFKVIYRIIPGNSMDKSLKADELLNRLGYWASENKPNLGEGIRVTRVTPTSQAELYAQYESGDEDHQIMMRITYEVI